MRFFTTVDQTIKVQLRIELVTLARFMVNLQFNNSMLYS